VDPKLDVTHERTISLPNTNTIVSTKNQKTEKVSKKIAECIN